MARRIATVIAVFVVAMVVGGTPGSAMRDVRFRPPHVSGAAHSVMATVVVITEPSATVRAFLVDARGASLDAEVHATPEGKASLSLPVGEHWLTSEAPGKFRASTMLVVMSGERTINLPLGPEQHLTIRVQDERGEPIDRAEVEVLGAEPLPVGAKATPDGSVEVGRLTPAPWMVTVRADGFEEATLRGIRGTEPLIVTLRRLGALTVTVLDSTGAPTPSARVLIAGASLWPARMAQTQPNGSIRIGSLQAGVYALRAIRGGEASPIELGVGLGRGEEKQLSLKLGPSERVDVEVVDSETDASIPGARVTAAELGLSPFPVEGTSDVHGRARLGPLARGPTWVSADAEGFVARSVLVEPTVEGVVSARLALLRAGTLRGRVLDRRGYPVDGATLEVVGTDVLGAPIDEEPRRARFRAAHFASALAGPRPLLARGELGVMPGPLPPIPHAPTLGLDPAVIREAPGERTHENWVTRADGTFSIAPVPPGRVRVLVRHPQFVEAMSEVVLLAPAAQAEVEVVLRAGGFLEGRVVDAGGRPVAARVTVAATQGTLERATRTSSDGTFAFASLPGSVAVSVSREEDPLTVVARATVDVPDGGRREITVALPEPRPTLEVRVVDDRGYPLDAAQVSAVSLEPGSALRSTAFTDSKGTAELRGARGLPLRVEVRAPGHSVRVLTVPATSDALRVELAPALFAQGEVRDRNGQSIAGAEIDVFGENVVRHTRSDGNGSFALEDVPKGKVRISVRAPGYAEKSIDSFVATPNHGRSFEFGRFELSAESWVEGVIVDERGEPVPGARVARDRVPVFLSTGSTPHGLAIADAKGRFKLDQLPAGSFVLEAYAPDVGRTPIDGVHLLEGSGFDVGRITLVPERDALSKEPAAPGGVAVTLGETRDGRVVVVEVAGASEAERAGLRAGDILSEIDGRAVSTMSDARVRLSGPLANDVLVRVRRSDRIDAFRVARESVRR